MENRDLHLNEGEQHQLEMIMHEIYSSLNSITTSLRQASQKDLEVAENRAQVKECIMNVSQYADTIRLYLDYWQISNGDTYFDTTPMRMIDIWGTFNRPNEYFKWLMKKKRIDYRVTKYDRIVPCIEAYPIIHVVANILLDNAIKYSPDSDEIDCLFEVDGNDLSITLENNGPYLPADDIAGIFASGTRGEYACRAGVRGHGYGMNFLKTIVDAHDGDIEIRSSNDFTVNGIPYGRYSCRITLPIHD